MKTIPIKAILVLALTSIPAVPLWTSPALAAPAQATRVGPNVDVAGEAAPDRQVVEPTIAIDPRDAHILVAGAQDLRLVARGGHRWAGYYRSINGGQTWSSSLVPGFPGDMSPQGLASPLKNFSSVHDTNLAFDSMGNAYYAGVAANFPPNKTLDLQTARTFVARYSNDGATYVGATVFADKIGFFPRIAVDTSGGPQDGNVYVTFDSDGAVFSRSTDQGQTFSPPIKVGGFPFGVAVAPDGSIFVLAEQVAGAKARLLVSKSTDGGVTFGQAVVAAAVTTLPTFFSGNSFLLVGGLTRAQIASDANGEYIVTDDFTSGNANILFTRSIDGGLTWSSPITLNDVSQGQHFFPTMAASGGVISVAWYDSRQGQLPSGTITALDVFFADSTNAGASFSSNLRVTSASFDPNLVVSSDSFFLTTPWIGDYISIAASPTAVHVIWTDNRNACDTVDPTYGCVDQDALTQTISP